MIVENGYVKRTYWNTKCYNVWSDDDFIEYNQAIDDQSKIIIKYSQCNMVLQKGKFISINLKHSKDIQLTILNFRDGQWKQTKYKTKQRNKSKCYSTTNFAGFNVISKNKSKSNGLNIIGNENSNNKQVNTTNSNIVSIISNSNCVTGNCSNQNDSNMTDNSNNNDNCLQECIMQLFYCILHVC